MPAHPSLRLNGQPLTLFKPTPDWQAAAPQKPFPKMGTEATHAPACNQARLKKHSSRKALLRNCVEALTVPPLSSFVVEVEEEEGVPGTAGFASAAAAALPTACAGAGATTGAPVSIGQPSPEQATGPARRQKSRQLLVWGAWQTITETGGNAPTRPHNPGDQPSRIVHRECGKQLPDENMQKEIRPDVGSLRFGPNRSTKLFEPTPHAKCRMSLQFR